MSLTNLTGTERKTFYVSGQATKLSLSYDAKTIDIGCETKSENEYMAAVNFYRLISSFCSGEITIRVSDVEEIADDQ